MRSIPTLVPDLGKPLTFRQTQIVEMVSEGKPNKQIAYELHLTTGTVKIYMMRIFRKAGVTNRTALAVWWINGGKSKPLVTE